MAYCARHGEKGYANNSRRKYRLDSDLTSKGREEARRGAELVKDKGITKIVSSPYLRTRATAAIYAKELSIRTVEIEPLLSECLVNQKGVNARDWRPSTLSLHPVSIETMDEYKQRMKRLYESMRGEMIREEATTHKVLYVSHGFNIATLKAEDSGDEVTSSEITTGACVFLSLLGTQ